MKRTIFYILVATFGMTLQGLAQKDVEIPQSAKIVRVVNNVNFRKGPTTDSPKLLEKCRAEKNNDGMIVSMYYEGFTWDEKDVNYTYMTAHPDYLMIIDDTSEWFHGYALDSYHKLPKVYVSKKAVKTKPVQKIDVPYLKKCEVKFSIRNYGKYNGYYIISGGPTSLPSTDDYMFIGTCIDGILYGKLFAPEIDKDMKGWGFAKLPPDYDINDDLSDPMIDHLFEIAQPGTVILTAGKVVTYYPKGSEEWDGFERFYYSRDNLMR